MAEYNRKNMIEAIKDHAKGHIKKHTMNVEIYLKNAVGVGEHPDVLEAVEKELKIIAEYDDQLEVINKYFEQDPLKPIQN
jgi:hypothetical protein